MSIRLNVVLSQSSDGSPQRCELESEIVARLIGAAGIDLGLIGSLHRLTESSTDRLMLERLSGDLALLSWDPPAEAAERLAAAEIGGRRAPHSLDPPPTAAEPEADRPSQPADRRIYHHHLAAHSADSLQAAIERLLGARRVVTFQLAPADRVSPSASNPSASNPSPSKSSPSKSSPTNPSPSNPSPTNPSPSSPQPLPAVAESLTERGGPRATDRAAAPDRWDALVDELNDSNI